MCICVCMCVWMRVVFMYMIFYLFFAYTRVSVRDNKHFSNSTCAAQHGVCLQRECFNNLHPMRKRERERENYCITLMLVFVKFSTLVSACLLDHRQRPPCSRSRQWFSFQGESLLHQVPSERITASSNHHPLILGHVRWPTKVLSLFLVKCSCVGFYNESKRFKSCQFESF